VEKEHEIDIEAFYSKYGPMVLRRCRFLLHDEDRALDAMQDVFVQVLKNKKKLKNTYPSSLLYTIATNICLNIIKKEKRIVTDTYELLLKQIATYGDPEERVVINDYLNYLFRNEKETTREIAVMHYIDRMTLHEVSQRTGLSVSGIRKRLRTLKKKAKLLQEAEL
jgi:RNA polymerase sigma-70 factor, ECF subfamily